jgi:quercetin dioxygenase-like cupin family protein
MSIPYLAQQADHQQLEWMGGGIMRVLLDTQATAGQLTVLRSHLPGGSASPVHVHSAEDEMFVLLRGDAVFWAGPRRYELSEGGVAFLPRNLPHAYRFVSDEVDLLTLCVPSGIEGFFRTAGRDLAKPKPEGWQLTPQTMAAAAVAFGQRIIGPPLDADAEMPATYLDSTR